MLIPKIDELIEADAKNVPACKELLFKFSPDLPEAIDQSATLYDTAARVWGLHVSEVHWNEISEVRAQLGADDSVTDLELATREPEMAAAVDRFFSREIRGFLLLRLAMWNSLAMAEILRFRVTPAFNYHRLQAESIAWMKLMVQNPGIAREWRDLKPEEGLKFHNKHIAPIKEAVREIGLQYAYDNASGIAGHSRMAGLALAMDMHEATTETKLSMNFHVRAQEFEEENPGLFLAQVLFALRTQERILTALPVVVPEIDDPIFIDQRVPTFRKQIDALGPQFARRYPRVVAGPGDA